MQIALIIEALALEFTLSLSPRAAHLTRSRGMLAHLTFEFTLGVCLLAFLPGVGGGVKIGKNSARNQPKALIPSSKNQIFQRFFNCLAGIELRESRIGNRVLFSYQTCR